MSNKCSSPGDTLNNWIPGCEHSGREVSDKTITNLRATGAGLETSKAQVTPTSKGLGSPTASNDKLNSWAPEAVKGESSTLRPVDAKSLGVGESKPLKSSESAETSAGPSAPSSPTPSPSQPSSPPYIWKYQ